MLLIVLMTIMTSAVSAQNSRIEFEEFTLKNGLRVIMHRDTTNPIVSVNIWYLVGSKDEDSGRTGFAHLFEHIMFQGSKNVGKTEHFSYINKAGGTLNGTTNQDRTNYFETVPSNQLELVLWLESDRMMYLDVNQENFDNQREVVKEEKRERYDNRPYGSWVEKMLNAAFPGHPYFMPTIGSMEDLNNAGLEDAQNFYKRFYRPDNAVLVISGDIDYKETKGLVEKYFSVGGNNSLSHPWVRGNYPEIKFYAGEIRDTIYDNVQLPALYIGYRIEGYNSEDRYALNVISSILSDGRSSRLYRNIVYEKKLAKSVNTFVWDLQIGGLVMITSTGYPQSDLKNIEEEIQLQIERIKTQPVSAQELEKAKNGLENDFTEMRQTTMGKADLLAFYKVNFNNPELINSDIENYLRVTPEDIMKTANKYFVNDNRVVLYYVNKNK
jgi:zinc protease